MTTFALAAFRYALAVAISSELQRLAAAEEGGRNVRLNFCAFSLARFVAAGWRRTPRRC